MKWNPTESNLLASGYEKHRSDHSILIWDVLKGPADYRSYSSHSSVLGLQNTDYIRPVMEIGLSDIAHSISWFNQSPHVLVVGVNNKNLKVLDIRGKIFPKFLSSCRNKIRKDVITLHSKAEIYIFV